MNLNCKPLNTKIIHGKGQLKQTYTKQTDE